MALKSKAQATVVRQRDEAIPVTVQHGDEEMRIPRDAMPMIRDALLIGLASYGEIERLRDAVELRRSCGSVPEDLVPILTSDDPHCMGGFVDALRILAMASDDADAKYAPRSPA